MNTPALDHVDSAEEEKLETAAASLEGELVRLEAQLSQVELAHQAARLEAQSMDQANLVAGSLGH